MKTISETKPFTWNGWEFQSKRKYGKLRHYKLRHNPNVKGFVETMEISSDEFQENAKKYSNTFDNGKKNPHHI